MKNKVLKTVVFFICFISYTTGFSQDVALSTFIKPFSNYYNFSNKVVIKNAALEDGSYTYKYKRKVINVEIKNGYYYEYFRNNQYLKAKIDWLSEFTYKLTIVDVETSIYPFKKEDTLVGEIIKIEQDKFYYKTLFKGRELTGNFRKNAALKE